MKKSSSKNLSADCLSTDYRQVTNTIPTANREVTNSLQNTKFVVRTCSKHDPETIIIPILTDRWYETCSGYIIHEFGDSSFQSHALSNNFFPCFGGRQSNVSMTITASRVSRTTLSMSIFRVSELLFRLYLTCR